MALALLTALAAVRAVAPPGRLPGTALWVLLSVAVLALFSRLCFGRGRGVTFSLYPAALAVMAVLACLFF
jgi:hypothetical protein